MDNAENTDAGRPRCMQIDVPPVAVNFFGWNRVKEYQSRAPRKASGQYAPRRCERFTGKY
jgi:hypothetical protein